MTVRIDPQRCTGCNLCVFSCPEKALSCYALAVVDREKCTDCLECLLYCPMEAIDAGGVKP